MSSSIDINSDEITTATCSKDDNDSTEDIALAAKQLTLQIDHLSIENEESHIPSATESTINAKNITTCAACGNEGDADSMNICNKCKMAHYCNAACKKKHKSKHKKKCERRVAELHFEKLFKKPPRNKEDCPICMLPLPPPLSYKNHQGTTFQSCCGKIICNGCIYAMKETRGEITYLCPFCKTPAAKSVEEEVTRLGKLMERGNADACYQLAAYYKDGRMGLPQDGAKSSGLYLKAGELGCADGYHNLGTSYYAGMGVEVDMKKATQYWELAVMDGSVESRHNLGILEGKAGNDHRAMKHFLLAASVGYKYSLDAVKQGFMNGHASKDQYANALREYQKSHEEIKSDARDKAQAYLNDKGGTTFS